MPNYDVYPRLQTPDQSVTDVPPGAIPAALGVPTIPIVLPFAIAAGAGGSADDVNLFGTPGAPFKFKIIDSKFNTTTLVAASTVTVRTAAAGGGSAASSALSSAAAGVARDALTTATITVAAGGALFLRRSDSGVAGELYLTVIPIQ